jgi:DNA/RNA endonuclease G (NUC1)
MFSSMFIALLAVLIAFIAFQLLNGGIVMCGLFSTIPGQTIQADRVQSLFVSMATLAIPTAFFKAAYDPAAHRVIAFILPNEKVDKHGLKAWDALQPYRVTLRTIEERAGLNLLKGLEPRERRRLSTMLSVMWPVRKPC